MSVRRIGIVAKHGLVAASEHVSQLGGWLRARDVEVVYEADTATLAGRAAQGAPTTTRDLLPHHVDVIVVLGGDGTLLAVAACIARSGRDIPILGVNFGSLGFLTEIRIDELLPSLEAVLEDAATLDERMMLEAVVRRDDREFDSRIVLNDVVFTKAALSRMIELSVSVSGGFVTRVKADGLIIASATGSTAYNLAAGGPIVHPMVDALILTPIAPHTLTNRPVVIPGGEVVDVRPYANGTPDDVFITYDGQSGYPLKEGDVIRVRKSEHVLRLVRGPALGYFEVLREKLKWGER
jgi:NAD+ kinase